MAEPAILSDVAPLASCLRVLILDSKRRQAIGTASRERASSIFRQATQKPSIVRNNSEERVTASMQH